MKSIVQERATKHTPDSLAHAAGLGAGTILLQSALVGESSGRFSFVARDPFLTLRATGSALEIVSAQGSTRLFGCPWAWLEQHLARYELRDDIDVPFPLGGAFGYWGYDLRQFTSPRMTANARRDLDLPDAVVGFYDSLVVFDHCLDRCWIVSTGLRADGSRDHDHAVRAVDAWRSLLDSEPVVEVHAKLRAPRAEQRALVPPTGALTSTLDRDGYVNAVRRAKEYIRQGDIYQVNLARRIDVTEPVDVDAWRLYRSLASVSPAPYAAFQDCGDFALASSSPELFLRMSGSHIRTRPIKGTRPRSSDPGEDARLAYELQTSAKEQAELVMITDLLRNDLGQCCRYGAVQAPELMRLERFSHVQHLVSTVEGTLREDVSHVEALRRCFPGGSITGAPKVRAMQLIDSLEPVSRGPYTGAIGYLGFNLESQISILIRVALCMRGVTCFYTGAGIVADSDPEAEFDETEAKAAGFLAALPGALSCGWEVESAGSGSGFGSAKARISRP